MDKVVTPSTKTQSKGHKKQLVNGAQICEITTKIVGMCKESSVMLCNGIEMCVCERERERQRQRQRYTIQGVMEQLGKVIVAPNSKTYNRYRLCML